MTRGLNCLFFQGIPPLEWSYCLAFRAALYLPDVLFLKTTASSAQKTSSDSLTLSAQPTDGTSSYQSASSPVAKPNMALMLVASKYTIGWICALEIELIAAMEMLDEEHERIPVSRSDQNNYTLGRIGHHNIVIACLAAGSTGLVPAATVAVHMARSFPNLQFALMVGIGGGVPRPPERDIRLGDVVVSYPKKLYPAVIQYDLGKRQEGGFIRTGSLQKPPAILLSAAKAIQGYQQRGLVKLSKHLSQITRIDGFRHPGQEYDRLFNSDYRHHGRSCNLCKKGKAVRRSARRSDESIIHLGTIASGNSVMKNGTFRDQVDKELHGILCFEMEAAGMMDIFPCLVIRGIADYSDSHKNDVWHGYAAATAASFAKELLLSVRPSIADNIGCISETRYSSPWNWYMIEVLRKRVCTYIYLSCLIFTWLECTNMRWSNETGVISQLIDIAYTAHIYMYII
jgi:nucleoside phosphorylase